MRRTPTVFLLLLALPMLSGCLARTAVDIVTLPVKIVGEAADLATTSQSEADEKRGRELRNREEELGKLDREYNEQLRDCHDGDRRACNRARETYAEIQQLLPTVPVDPQD